jgi:hypothetical protein
MNGEGRLPIAEVPLSTVRVGRFNFPIAGGGYFRMLPYAVTHRAMLYLNRVEKQPAVFYFHPWEIDPDQPRIQAGWLSRFRHYTNLGAMERKLRKLLASFAFAPIRDVHGAALNVSSRVEINAA